MLEPSSVTQTLSTSAPLTGLGLAASGEDVEMTAKCLRGPCSVLAPCLCLIVPRDVRLLKVILLVLI